VPARDDPASAAVARAAEIAAIGLRDTADAAVDTAVLAALDDADARVRAAAVASAVRAGTDATATVAVEAGLRDESPAVRRRAAELVPELAPRADRGSLARGLVDALDEHDATVIEAVAWALGELGADAVAADATAALARAATTHDDPLAREAAVAALGALGDPAGLDAILRACTDKPAVRRRAVLALAPFEGDAVEAALAAALDDRDWQVRQAAEDLRR
jgi:HEAT repeat protein